MTITLPTSGTWIQNNRTDVSNDALAPSTLWSSFNLNLTEKLGSTMVSPRTMITTDNLTDLGTTCAFQTFSDQNAGLQYYWAVSGKYVWRARTDSGYITAFAKDISAGTPSGADSHQSCADDISDLVTFGKTKMAVTTNDRLYYYTALTGQWLNMGSNSADNLTSSAPHMLCTFGNRVYVTDNGTQIRSTTNTFADGTLTTSGSNFLDLAIGGYQVTAITKLIECPDGIWIPSVNQSENDCFIFKWDGVTNNVVIPYEIKDANGILTGIIIGSTPWVIDNNGRLLYFNGGSFAEAPNGHLPVRSKKLLTNPLSGTNNRWIHPNGIALVGGRINILVNNKYNDNAGSIEENLPSGIWEYDENIGWYHKSSLSLYLQSGGSITDFGQNRLATVGALYANKTNSTSATADGTFLAGAQYYSDATTTRYGIWTNNSLDTIQKGGYLVTPKLFGESIEDTWNKVYIILKPYLDGGDALYVKYTTSDIEPTEISITWSSTTRFTTTDANMANYAVGDEVEGTQGKGSGQTAHITAINGPRTGTYIVDVDTAFTGVGSSGTAKVRLQKWVSMGSAVTNGSQYKEYSMSPNATWIKVKVYMLFTGRDLINKLEILSNGSKK